MSYNRIKFTQHWDKLTDSEFTTIRSWNPGKETYYRSLVGQKFTALFYKRIFQQKNGKLICHVYLKDMQVVDPKEIPQSVLERDVTLDREVNQAWLQKILKMPKVIVLTFNKVVHEVK
jgi:hypothetical protein